MITGNSLPTVLDQGPDDIGSRDCLKGQSFFDHTIPGVISSRHLVDRVYTGLPHKQIPYGEVAASERTGSGFQVGS